MELLVLLLENLEWLLLLWLLDWRWLQRQVLITVVIVVHVLFLRVLLLDANDLLDYSVIRLLLEHVNLGVFQIREDWLVVHFDFILKLELLQNVVFAGLVVARGSFSVFERWRALSHAKVLIRMRPLSVSSVALVLLFIPSIVGSIFRTLNLLDVNALCLGVWVDVSEGESWSVPRCTSF